ncbi:MAG: acyl-CoA thioester hydrolase/BAAT C-terminal domain-containing protein [Planctomycetota bacterium]
MSAHHHAARRLLAVALLSVAAPAGGVAQSAAAAPRIELLPAGDALVGTPLTVRVSGLPNNTQVVLFSQLVDRYGRLWTGESTWASDAAGTVDPSRVAPLAAAWDGTDPAGPLWSVDRKTVTGAHPRPAGGDAERVAITAIVAGRPVATAATRRWFRTAAVEELPVDHDTLVGRLFAPRDGSPRAAILVVPGSGGGIPSATAGLLASHGYVALALAYFGEPGLPPELELVPLELIDTALDWLKRHPRVAPDRLGIYGGSKGGELALLMASRRPDLRAAVAAVPSSVVFQSIADDWPRTSSWSLNGEGLPFVPYSASARFRTSGRLSDLYEDSLEDREAAARARIAVERAAGAILLISGRDDRTWPATAMCEEIVAQLERADFPHRVEHLAYDDVGHEVFAPGYRPASWSPAVGGTRQGQAAAQADVWPRAIAFLADALGAPPRAPPAADRAAERRER